MFFLTVVSLIFFIGSANSLACNSRAQCLSVSQQINYVECVTNNCACLLASGFSGAATVESKCQCVSPSKVAWLESGEPYCFAVADALSYKRERAQEEYQTSVIRQVYDALVWPGPRNIMISLISGQPSIIYNYFAEDAQGRVDPVGTFNTHDGIVEYFYGLTWTGAARITKVEFKKLISQNNIVHSNVVLTFDMYDQTQQHVVFSYNLTQSGSFTFNLDKKIKSADMIIHNLGEISDPMTPQTPEYIGQLCYIILNVAGCNATHDPLGYYVDMPDCMQYLSQKKWGSMNNVYFDGNTTICSFFHSLLSIGRPHVHCSHSGKTGGNKCVRHDYSSYYTKDYKKRGLPKDSRTAL